MEAGIERDFWTVEDLVEAGMTRRYDTSQFLSYVLERLIMPAWFGYVLSGDNRDGGRAISAGCPGRLGGTRHRCGVCGGDIPDGAAVDNPAGCKQTGGDDNGKAETVAGNSGSGDHS